MKIFYVAEAIVEYGGFLANHVAVTFENVRETVGRLNLAFNDQ